MKKFLTKIMFAAVAILSATGFTSCNAEDDGYDYTANTSTTTPTVKTVSVYSAIISEDCMKLYDVSVTLHSGDKSKTVALTESNGIKMSLGSGQAYTFSYDNVDGQYNIDKVEASVTPKANIESMISAMDPNSDVLLVTSKVFADREFKANGQYDVASAFKTISFSVMPVGNLTQKLDNGDVFYKQAAETYSRRLSK